MHSISKYCVSLALIGVAFALIGLPSLSAQQSAASAACNQPMQDAITHVKIQQAFLMHAIASRDGCWLFVFLSGTNNTGNLRSITGVAVMRRNAGSVEQVRVVPLNITPKESSEITKDGKTLIVTDQRSVAFLDTEKLIAGGADPILARVGDQRFSNSIGVAVTSDATGLFVSQNGTAWVSVVNLTGAGGGFDRSKIEGGIPTGAGLHSPVLSPDERFLYVPSAEGADTSWPAICNSRREGSIQVIDVQRARTNAALPVVATIKAGCSTRRVAVSPDGNTVFATAAEDNAMLAFDVRPLRSGLSPTLVGKVPVGSFPVGLVVADRGRKVVVANSNSVTGGPDDKATLTVIDAARITEGRSAVMGTIPAGADPRNIAVTSDGLTLLVSNRVSGTLQIVDMERVELQSSQAAPKAQADQREACKQPLPDAITHVKVEGYEPRVPVSTRDGCWVFASLGPTPSTVGGVAVLRKTGNTLQQARFVPVNGLRAQIRLTPDEKILVATTSGPVVFLDVERLMSGNGDPMLGSIIDNRFSDVQDAHITSDGRYVMVGSAGTEWISIIDLDKARASGFNAGAIVGGVAGGGGYLLFSPDEKYLYVRGMLTDPNRPKICADPPRPQSGILVFDVGKLRSGTPNALIAEVSAGCDTARLDTSPDGNTIYATLRGENALVAFDTRPVRTGSAPVLIGRVPVGMTPISVIAVDGGRKLVVANSRSAGGPNDQQKLTVIDSARVAEGAGAVVGTIPAGADPRWMTLAPDGHTLMLGNLKSQTIEIIDIDRVKLDPVK